MAKYGESSYGILQYGEETQPDEKGIEPFKFDVHAIIFSEDAPALEAALHERFRKYELNKVNPRKEFFKVPISEIQKVVNEFHSGIINWIIDPPADEYRESLRRSIEP